MPSNSSRAPKHLGDFGEGLVTYSLVRNGWEVASVDHVGADLIAWKNRCRIAVSVKTRLYRHRSVETRGTVIRYDHILKLKYFSEQLDFEPVFAHAVCIADDRIIHLFILRVEDIEKHLDKVAHGYRFRFSEKHLQRTIALPYVDYSSWCNESIGLQVLS